MPRRDFVSKYDKFHPVSARLNAAVLAGFGCHCCIFPQRPRNACHLQPGVARRSPQDRGYRAAEYPPCASNRDCLSTNGSRHAGRVPLRPSIHAGPFQNPYGAAPRPRRESECRSSGPKYGICAARHETQLQPTATATPPRAVSANAPAHRCYQTAKPAGSVAKSRHQSDHHLTRSFRIRRKGAPVANGSSVPMSHRPATHLALAANGCDPI